MIIDAILPAGGRIQGDFAREAGVEVKALAHVNGATLLQHALRATLGTGRVRRCVVVGPTEVSEQAIAEGAAAVLPEAATGPDNIYRGLDYLRSTSDGARADRVLIMATDLPFVTSAALTAFLDSCPAKEAVCLPAITREAFQARFPGSVNRFVPLRDGCWTIAGVFLVDPAALVECKVHIDRVYRARKSALAMGLLLGLPLILRFLTRQLAICHIEARCAAILGCSGSAVLGCPAELAFDIDLPVEYRYAMQHSCQEDDP